MDVERGGAYCLLQMQSVLVDSYARVQAPGTEVESGMPVVEFGVGA